MNSDIKEHDEHATPHGLSSAESAKLQRLVTLDSGETVRLHDAAITIANMFQSWIDRSPSSEKIMPTEYPNKQTVKNWISVLSAV